MSDAPKFKSFADKPAAAGSFRALRSVPAAEKLIFPVPSDASGMDKYGQDKYEQDRTNQNKPGREKNVETSPVRNFTKTSNSIVRQAIPEKYFRGQSKHTYDVLYHRTRGAITPIREIQLSKTELVRLTGLAEKTVQLHIRYLRDSKLINVHPRMGSRNGWVYEVLVPEEIESLAEYARDRISRDWTSMDKTRQNLSSQTMQNLSILVHTNPLENKELSDSLRLSSKTSTNDDEAFAGFCEKFRRATDDLTGGKLSKKDAENLEKLADLLILELKIAARRTDNISSVPAFLIEVLRRKLRDAPQESAKPVKAKIDTVGKSEKDSYEIKTLDRKGRDAALEQLREFAGEPLIQDFKKWYTEEDWNWLTEKLEINQSNLKPTAEETANGFAKK